VREGVAEVVAQIVAVPEEEEGEGRTEEYDFS
jgi:hypothetical protein